VKTTISYTMYDEDDSSQMNALMKASDAQSLLWDIDQKLRNTLKHSDEGWLEKGGYEYLQGLRDMIYDSGAYVDQ